MNGFGQRNTCTVPQSGCQYAIKMPLVNDRLFEMSFRSKKLTSGLPFYVFQPVMDKNAWVNDVID